MRKIVIGILILMFMAGCIPTGHESMSVIDNMGKYAIFMSNNDPKDGSLIYTAFFRNDLGKTVVVQLLSGWRYSADMLYFNITGNDFNYEIKQYLAEGYVPVNFKNIPPEVKTIASQLLIKMLTPRMNLLVITPEMLQPLTMNDNGCIFDGRWHCPSIDN